MDGTGPRDGAVREQERGLDDELKQGLPTSS